MLPELLHVLKPGAIAHCGHKGTGEVTGGTGAWMAARSSAQHLRRSSSSSGSRTSPGRLPHRSHLPAFAPPPRRPRPDPERGGLHPPGAQVPAPGASQTRGECKRGPPRGAGPRASRSAAGEDGADMGPDTGRTGRHSVKRGNGLSRHTSSHLHHSRHVPRPSRLWPRAGVPRPQGDPCTSQCGQASSQHSS